MNFECHITVSTEHAEKATFFADHTHRGGKWKTSEIARDPVLGADTYFYLTAHDTAYEQMHARMKYAAAWLRENGVPVLREKIELIMYDTKQKPVDPRIALLFEAYDFSQFNRNELAKGLAPHIVELLHNGLEALYERTYNSKERT